MVVHCIGDSHANFFSGFDEMQPEWPDPRVRHRYPMLRAYRIGPALAFNLCRTRTTTRGRERLFALLDTLPARSPVMLCFGEIDCRAHILRQAERQRRSVGDVVREVVDRYVSVLLEVQAMGFRVLAWNVVPSAPTDVEGGIRPDPVYRFHGSSDERNRITRAFNETLKAVAATRGIPFVDIFAQLIGDDGTVRTELYCDDAIHLSQKAMPLALERLETCLPGFHTDGGCPQDTFARRCRR